MTARTMPQGAAGALQGAPPAGDGPATLRLDRFLVFARFFRTRARAQALIGARRVRINGQAVNKAHALVRPGDVLTFPQAQEIRVVRILCLPLRRGSAPEAAMLYEEVPPPEGPGPG